MAYSNITPPTLPEYDSALYSHYVLEFEYENGLDNWFAVSLRYSSTPFTYDGAAVTNAGEHHLQTYGSATGEWTYWGTLTEMSIAPGTTATGGYRRIWTNHDILDGSGKVWLAANMASPAESNQDRLSIMKSKLAGLIMAWCAPVRQFPQREPVAFLYGHVAKEGETHTHTINGVGYVGAVCPDIYTVYTPELQKQFPHVSVYDGYGGEYFDNDFILCISETPYEQEEDEYLTWQCGANKSYGLKNGAWELWGETDWHKFYLGTRTNLPVWTNTTILYTDETVYLEKSDPIPIYE